MNTKDKEDLSERFTHELWPINRRGNHEYALSSLIRACDNKFTVEGNPVTFDLIKEKYTEYKRFMDENNRDRDPKFASKIEDIGSFISHGRYNEDFNFNPNQTLDLYLYGN